MTSERNIQSVAVLGASTMGLGIAALCADRGFKVLLLDIPVEGDDRSALANTAVERMKTIRPPALENPDNVANIRTGNFDDDLDAIAGYDWICEVVVEDLTIKQNLLERIEAVRRQGSIVSTNTSGILLRHIVEGMPARLRSDMAVTHFFNPVAIMKLVELVPGLDTDGCVIDALAAFCEGLGKGVVNAKDTVNFIGNRIGCFWILAGMHKSQTARAGGLDTETIDALMGAPVGIPKTGLYGLIDLIGLDVMDHIAGNLAENLPDGDAGRAYLRFPPVEKSMLDAGQLGRKTGGGFFRMLKNDDGSRQLLIFEPETKEWRPARDIALDETHASLESLLFADTPEGAFAWDLLGETLHYAADLIPEIAEDVVSIDRAMRWGFNWARGPFEMLDAAGPARFIKRLEAEGRPIPAMLRVLGHAAADTFYRDGGARYLGLDGVYHPVP
jgi:3-hydroxyacyl-CoA dehydrogenase